MFYRDRIPMTAKMKRGYAGLPRRKVCVRAVHHIFRVLPEVTGGGEAKDECPP